jgi:hypothetical protein
MKQTRSWLLLIGLMFVNACQPEERREMVTPVPTATAEPPTATPALHIQILFIGASFVDYNRGLDNHLEGLAASPDPSLVIDARKIAGWGVPLGAHWHGAQAVPAIQKGNWNAVVLSENISRNGLDEEAFYEYARKFAEPIKNVGTETVLLMVWQPENGSPITTGELANVFNNLGTELGVRVALAGLAWERSIAERPDLDLYAADRAHPNIAGTYLTTAELYATILGESPEGLSYLPSDLIGGEGSALYEKWKMSDEDITFLQQIAWETVVDYQEHNK